MKTCVHWVRAGGLPEDCSWTRTDESHLLVTIFDILSRHCRCLLLTFSIGIPLVNHTTRTTRWATRSTVCRAKRRCLLLRLCYFQLSSDNPLSCDFVAAAAALSLFVVIISFTFWRHIWLHVEFKTHDKSKATDTCVILAQDCLFIKYLNFNQTEESHRLKWASINNSTNFHSEFFFSLVRLKIKQQQRKLERMNSFHLVFVFTQLFVQSHRISASLSFDILSLFNWHFYIITLLHRRLLNRRSIRRWINVCRARRWENWFVIGERVSGSSRVWVHIDSSL